MRHYTEAEVRELLPMAECVPLMKEVFRALGKGEAQNQPRRRLLLPNGAILHQLAGAYGGYFGAKIYSSHPEHGANFTVLLYDAGTAKPAAQFEANYLGRIRTGAVTGAAADVLADPAAERIGIIGSGFQAMSQLEAVLQVRRITQARVWSRDSARRNLFADECAHRFSLLVLPADSARDAVAEAQIVVTATSAREPILEGGMLAPGTLVCAMGSNNAQRREIAASVIDRAGLLVADSVLQCQQEAGDLILGLPEARKDWRGVIEFSSIVAGDVDYHYDRGRIVFFKSVGLGVEDIGSASWIHEHSAIPAP